MATSELDENQEFLKISFCYEDWAISHAQRILSQLKNANEAEKMAMAEDLALENLFLIRRVSDPAFGCYVYSQIQSDREFLMDMKKKIMKIIASALEDPETVLKKLRAGAVSLNNIESVDLQSSSIREISQANKAKIIEYLTQRATKSFAQGDYDETQAAESVLQDYVSGRFHGHEVLKHHSLLEGSFYSDAYRYRALEFVTRNVKYLDVYQSKSRPHLGRLSTNCEIELTNYIMTLLSNYAKIEGQDWLLFNKLLNDLLSISAIEWFISKSKTEKLRILNQTYSWDHLLAASGEKHETNVQMTPFWVEITRTLFKEGYFSEIISATLALIQNQKEIENNLLFFCYDDLATAYRSLGDHKSALKYYLESQKLIDSVDPQIREYHRLIKLIRIGEEYYQLEAEDRGKECLAEVERLMETLSENCQGQTFLNLAGTARRTWDFKAEARYLGAALDFISIKLVHKVQQRIDTICKDASLSSEARRERLFRLDQENEVQRLIMFGMSAIAAFHFSIAIDHCTAAYSIGDELGDNALRFQALVVLGPAYIYAENYAKARSCYERALEIDNKNPQVLAYLAALTLETEKTENYPEKLRFLSEKISSHNYLGFLSKFVYLLIQIRDLEELDDIICHLEAHMPVEKEILCLDVGSILADHGISNLAINFLEKGLDYTQELSIKAQILTNMGSIYANQDRHQEALAFYKKALEEDSTNAITYGNMAASSAYFMDFSSAQKHAQAAIELVKNDPTKEIYCSKLEWDEGFYDLMSQHKININQVAPVNPKVRDMLVAAEKFFLEFKRDIEKKDLDASPIIIEYAKALELMLHKRMAIPFLTHLTDRFGESIADVVLKASSRDFQRFIKQVKKGKSVSLGGWPHLLSKTRQARQVDQDSLETLFKEFIADKTSLLVLDRIAETCEIVSETRNRISHRETFAFDEVATLRPKIIEAINGLISLLY